MKVLIVEDDEEKAQDLARFVAKHFEGAEKDIQRSFQSGLRAALEGNATIMLLDMTMRNFDRSSDEEGGRPHHFAGREILRRLGRAGLHVPTIVVTNFDRFGEETEEVTLSELQAELATKFPDYLGTIHYRSNVDEWQGRLLLLMQSVLGRQT